MVRKWLSVTVSNCRNCKSFNSRSSNWWCVNYNPQQGVSNCPQVRLAYVSLTCSGKQPKTQSAVCEVLIYHRVVLTHKEKEKRT